MKKLSIIMLALALALAFTVPAMAIHIDDPDTPEGSLGISGRFQFDGEARDVDGAKSDFFDDDLDLAITLVKGDVKAFIGLEIADTNPFEGTSNKAPVDNYYIDWSAMDNLNLKIGEYGISFARAVGTDAAGARNIQLTYNLDALSISGAIMKESGSTGEDDNDTMYIKLSAKEAGPFTTLDLVSYSQMNDVSSVENSYTGVDLALPLGPVDFAMEYGGNGGDLDGSFMLFEIGLADLVGFDLGVNYFMSSDDYLAPYDECSFAPMMILGDQINEDVLDLSIIWLTAGYAVNDKLSLNGAVSVAAENDAGTEYGQEVNVGLKYKLADNVSYALAYGTYSAGDFTGVDAGPGIPGPTEVPWSYTSGASSDPDVDTTELWHRIEFKF